jgi:thioredoxin-like negative regulator of GroEL
MNPLDEHEYFEKMIGRAPSGEKDVIPSFAVIYFTAKWCGACKRLKMEDIMKSPFPKDTVWFKCDIDVNTYTAGYCNIGSIPTFMVVAKGQILGQLSSSNTAAVCVWLEDMVSKFQGA